MDPLAWVPLAEVARPHGVKGELRLKIYNSDSNLLMTVKEVSLRFPSGEERLTTIESARRADVAILLRLNAVTDRDSADQLRGAVICVQRRHFTPLDEGEFYVCDIEGARVLVASGQRELGKVRAFESYPTVDMLTVDPGDGGRMYEVPLTSDYIESIDTQAGVVMLTTIDGLERG